jgi:hypothetical protein
MADLQVVYCIQMEPGHVHTAFYVLLILPPPPTYHSIGQHWLRCMFLSIFPETKVTVCTGCLIHI